MHLYIIGGTFELIPQPDTPLELKIFRLFQNLSITPDAHFKH